MLTSIQCFNVRSHSLCHFLIMLSLTLGPSASASAEALKQICLQSQTVLQSIHLQNEGRFFYYETSPASPSSEAKIEFWSGNELQWDADVTRSCSQGVGRCWLYVPYLVDGELAGEIKSESNEITLPNDQRLVVFSHLRDKITYLYFKLHPFNDVTLQGASYNGTEYPRRQKMALPTAFVSVDCAP